MSFSPYLFFSGGDCSAAFMRYQEIFGGDVQVMKVGDAPEGERMPGADPEMIMHASLTVGSAVLMGSDDPTGDGGPKLGSAVSFTAGTAAEAQQVFGALSEGGEITMPYSETFWSKGFGMCTDKFGVPWMISAPDVAE